MLNILSAICFLAFVATGLMTAFSQRLAVGSGRRRLTDVFIVLALAFSFGAGLWQRDMWPFSSWMMMVGLTPPATRNLPTLRIVSVDAACNENNIDYRAWSPLSLEELYSWMDRNFFHLDPASQERVARYLLERSNRARERALTPGGLEYYDRLLGPLTAPTHVLHPAIWSQLADVPRAPFTGLRMYQENWDLEVSAGAPIKVTRVLVYEYLRR